MHVALYVALHAPRGVALPDEDPEVLDPLPFEVPEFGTLHEKCLVNEVQWT